MKTKTIKTPLMMAEAFGLPCCPCSLVPESELSHRYQVHHRLVPKLSHHRGKTPFRFTSLKNTMRDLTSSIIHQLSFIRMAVFSVFLLESLSPLWGTFWCQQEDAGSLLTARFMVTAEQGTRCLNFQEGFSRFLFIKLSTKKTLN